MTTSHPGLRVRIKPLKGRPQERYLPENGGVVAKEKAAERLEKPASSTVASEMGSLADSRSEKGRGVQPERSGTWTPLP